MLLTGATGFIGRHIQGVLLDAGVAVRIIIRPDSVNAGNTDPRCEQIMCGLSDVQGLRAAIDGVQAVVYCAGSVRGRCLDDFLPANVDGVETVLNALQMKNPQTPFLLVSSLAASRPQLSDYARSKYLGEQALVSSDTANWSILRPPAVYGPGDKEMLPILRMARRGLVFHPGSAQQQLSLLYVEDLARAVHAWLTHWQQCRGMTFAIDDGREGGYDWPAIVQAAGNAKFRAVRIPFILLWGAARINHLFSGISGTAPIFTPGKVRELTQDDWLCDNTAFVQASGWQPGTQLPCGIRLSLDEQPTDKTI